MILLNNIEIVNAPVDKAYFEYGNEIVWRNGKFLELLTLYRLLRQLREEKTIYNDLLIIDGLSFKNIIPIIITCFILKRTDIRVYSTIPLPETLPHTTINLVEMERDNESF